MTLASLPAVFMRGGTSKALMLHRRDVPSDQSAWPSLFLSAMGSPDPYGRQLNGMGGGVSSVSKICIVGPSARADADVDYTFVQVLVRDAHIDMSGNCGNMLSAVGPFAVDEGLLAPRNDGPTVRIYNTNTKKIMHSTFELLSGRARYDGALVIPGVSGSGAPIRLDFLEPGGATTGRLLPTGRPRDRLEIPGLGVLEASLVDAANACVFVRAADLGLSGAELPAALDAMPDALSRLAAIRNAASVAMGIARDLAHAATITQVPFVCVVSPAQPAVTMSGAALSAADMELTARVVSNGQPHQALPLTATLCLAVAAGIDGTIVNEVAAAKTGPGLRVGMPSGILTADAEIERRESGWHARRGSFFRTARPLFRGEVFVERAESGR